VITIDVTGLYIVNIMSTSSKPSSFQLQRITDLSKEAFHFAKKEVMFFVKNNIKYTVLTKWTIII